MTDKKEIERKLWELHAAAISYFHNLLTNNQEFIKGSTLDSIRAFLKDNAITRNELNKTKGLNLDDLLDDWDDEVDPYEAQDEDHKGNSEEQDTGFKFVK